MRTNAILSVITSIDGKEVSLASPVIDVDMNPTTREGQFFGGLLFYDITTVEQFNELLHKLCVKYNIPTYSSNVKDPLYSTYDLDIDHKNHISVGQLCKTVWQSAQTVYVKNLSNQEIWLDDASGPIPTISSGHFGGAVIANGSRIDKEVMREFVAANEVFIKQKIATTDLGALTKRIDQLEPFIRKVAWKDETLDSIFAVENITEMRNLVEHWREAYSRAIDHHIDEGWKN